MNNNLKTNRKKTSGHSQTFYRFSFQRVKKMLNSQVVAVTTDEILGLAQILAGGLTSGTGSVWKEVKSLKAKKRSRGRRRRFGFASFLRFVYTLRSSTRLKILWVDPERSRSRPFLNVCHSSDQTRVNLCADGRLSNERRRDSSVHSSNKAEETWRSGPLTLLMAPVFGWCTISFIFSLSWYEMRVGSVRSPSF